MSTNSGRQILSLGTSQYNFLGPLYSSINELDHRYEFKVWTTKDYSRWKRLADSNNWLSLLDSSERESLSAFQKLKSIGNPILNPLKLIKEQGLKTGKYEYLKRLNRYSILHSWLEDTELVHYHLLFPHNLHFSEFLPFSKPIVASFWGSDLFRVDSVAHIKKQSEFLEHCDLVTVQSEDMREEVLRKFGSYLEDRIRLVRFQIPSDIFDTIDSISYDKNSKDQWRAEFGIPEGLNVVVVGHNGSPFNQHERIIEALPRLSPEERKSIFIIVPATYLPSGPEHLEAIKKSLVDSGFQYNLLTDYMPFEKLAALRAIADIYIHAPVSDAMSATVIEFTYAGAEVICGEWLPYRGFDELGWRFRSLPDFDELPKQVRQILSGSRENDKGLEKRRKMLRDNFVSDKQPRRWIEIYEEALAK